MSLRDGFDLSTPSGRLMFQIIGAMGEFERNLIRERVKAGMAHARSKGRKLGRTSLCVDMNAVAARRASGESLRAIARDLESQPSPVGEESQRHGLPAALANSPSARQVPILRRDRGRTRLSLKRRQQLVAQRLKMATIPTTPSQQSMQSHIDGGSAHANPTWKATALAATMRIAARQETFTSFDVLHELE